MSLSLLKKAQKTNPALSQTLGMAYLKLPFYHT